VIDVTVLSTEMRTLKRSSCQSLQSIQVNQRPVHMTLSCWSCWAKVDMARYGMYCCYLLHKW